MVCEYTVALCKDADGIFNVSVPGLRGCLTFGDTLEEALAMAREAIQCYVESLIIDEEPIPPNPSEYELELCDGETEVVVRLLTVEVDDHPEPQAAPEWLR